MAPAKAQNEKADVLVFVSYSHRDEKAREQFDVHTAQLKREGVRFWFDGDMIAGAELDPNIRRQLKAADIFVALASPNYLHSNYCFEQEYGLALRKAGRGKVHVVVALIKPCQWRHTRMKNYKMLPKDAKAVAQWARHGDAYENIVEGLREVVKAARLARAGAPARNPVRAPAVPNRPAAPQPKPKPRPKSAKVARPKPAAKPRLVQAATPSRPKTSVAAKSKPTPAKARKMAAKGSRAAPTRKAKPRSPRKPGR